MASFYYDVRAYYPNETRPLKRAVGTETEPFGRQWPEMPQEVLRYLMAKRGIKTAKELFEQCPPQYVEESDEVTGTKPLPGYPDVFIEERNAPTITPGSVPERTAQSWVQDPGRMSADTVDRLCHFFNVSLEVMQGLEAEPGEVMNIYVNLDQDQRVTLWGVARALKAEKELRDAARRSE